MKPLPLPLRVAAGLVATAADKARELPKTVTGLPITVASQALQLSMRVQQQVTEMAIRGDNALAMLRPVEETPEWATFDEDVEDYVAPQKSRTNGLSAWDYATDEDEERDGPPVDDDPWAREERAVAVAASEGKQADKPNDQAHDQADDNPEDNPGHRPEAKLDDKPEAPASKPSAAVQAAPAPAAYPQYPELTIAQLRGRLRGFTLNQLRELLEYERGHQNRDEFTSMLSRRIDTVRAKQ